MWWNLNILRDTLKRGGRPNLILLSPAGVSRAYASSLLMCSGNPLNSFSALPALDAPVGSIQDFEDVISFDFSELLKSCIAQRNLEITLSETNKVAIKNYESGSADILPNVTLGNSKGKLTISYSDSSFLGPDKGNFCGRNPSHSEHLFSQAKLLSHALKRFQMSGKK